MPIALSEIRAELLPGLFAVRYERLPTQWDKLFAAPASPIMISPVVAVVMGAAAVIINNPTITRRFWSK
jgi:hypothetical protein